MGVVFYYIYINIIYSESNVKIVLKSRKYLELSKLCCTFASEIRNSSDNNLKQFNYEGNY